MSDEKIVVSLREIAERFGIGIEGARAKAKRRDRQGVWRILPQNHPADPLRVELPAIDFNEAEGTQRPNGGDHGKAPARFNLSPQTSAPSHVAQHEESHDIKALVALLEKMAEQTSHTTERLLEAERGRAEAEARAAVAESRATMAETAREADRIAAGERLERVRTELEEIARRQGAVAEEAHAALADWKSRPWWRRMVG
jgi:hypothetical protein